MFSQHAGYARFAYNWAVGEFKAGLDVGEWLHDRSLRPRWNRVKPMIVPWGAALCQNAAKYAIIDFGQAADAWGAHRQRVKAGQRSGRRVGFPRFKRRKHEQGFRADNGPDTVRVDGKVVILPNITVALTVKVSEGVSCNDPAWPEPDAAVSTTTIQWSGQDCREVATAASIAAV